MYRNTVYKKLIREGEFRKKVALKIIDGDNVLEINMLKLKEYHDIVERFISFIKENFL